MGQIKVCLKCKNEEIDPAYNYCKYCGTKLQIQKEEPIIKQELLASNRVFSEKELAIELGISYWSVRKMRIEQGLPCFQIGSRNLYRLSSVLQWMDEKEKREQEPKEEYGVIRKIK